MDPKRYDTKLVIIDFTRENLFLIYGFHRYERFCNLNEWQRDHDSRRYKTSFRYWIGLNAPQLIGQRGVNAKPQNNFNTIPIKGKRRNHDEDT